MSELPPRRSRAAPKKYDDYEQMDDDDDDAGMTSSSLKVKTTVGGVKPPAPARTRPLAVANAPQPAAAVVDTRAETKEEAALRAKYAQLREQAAEQAAESRRLVGRGHVRERRDGAGGGDVRAERWCAARGSAEAADRAPEAGRRRRRGRRDAKRARRAGQRGAGGVPAGIWFLVGRIEVILNTLQTL